MPSPFVIRGPVVHGDARGRRLGFPTANVAITGPPPRFGVYAGTLDGRPAAISVGVRPTFGAHLEPLAEAYVLDFDGDLYGADVVLELRAFLRPELRFDDVDGLVAQMALDVRRVAGLTTDT